MLGAIRDRGREESALRDGVPLFLEKRDSRGLYPEIATPHEIVRKIKRVDARWRVEWNRVRGRWFLFHDHDRFGRATMPTVVVEDSNRKYQPLDHRIVRRLAFGAYLERNGVDVRKFDEALQANADRLDQQYEDAVSDYRQSWLRENFRKMKQHFADGTFYDPDPEPDPRIQVDYGARA